MADAVAEIKEKIDIVDYIGRSIKLKKAGQNFKGLCPFHQERTPSFTVSPQRQVWHCFGCGKGGDLISYVMEEKNLDFKMALELLAEEAGVEIQKLHRAQKKDPRLYELHEDATRFYKSQLQDGVGTGARQYLAEIRKIDQGLIDLFQIGFAPNSWDVTGSSLIRKGYTEPELVKSGLAIRKNEQKSSDNKRGWYDRFRNRVIIPIQDHLGRVVGFAGRTLDSSDKSAKYINSPETEIFKKNQVLFGLNLAKDSISKLKYAVIVEGPLDVIAMHKVGIMNVVAPQGTALTESQLKILKRYTSRLKIMFDTDTAGINAALKAIKLSLPLGFESKLVVLSDAKDPDDAVIQSPDQLKIDMLNALEYFEYVVRVGKERFADDIDKLAVKLTEFALPFIKLTPNLVYQDKLLQRLASEVGVSNESLRVEMGKLKVKVPLIDQHEDNENISSSSVISSPIKLTREERLWHELGAILLQKPDEIAISGESTALLRDLTNHGEDLFYSRVGLCFIEKRLKGGNFELDEIESELNLNESEKDQISLLSLHDLGTIAQSEEAFKDAIAHIVRELNIINLKKDIKGLSSNKDLDRSELDEQYRELTRKLRLLERAK